MERLPPIAHLQLDGDQVPFAGADEVGAAAKDGYLGIHSIAGIRQPRGERLDELGLNTEGRGQVDGTRR